MAGRHSRTQGRGIGKAPPDCSRTGVCQVLDVTHEDAPYLLKQLIDELGGMDLFLLSSGIGKQNLSLTPDIELQTAATNVEGFIRMVTAAYHYFEQQGHGHLAVISSIAGTKGLGSLPPIPPPNVFRILISSSRPIGAYQPPAIVFTDIRPGFVATPLLKDDKYPLLMNVSAVAAHIINALNKKKRTVIIDRRYQVLVFFWRLIPKWLWVRLPVRN